jgi:hypothetical protein
MPTLEACVSQMVGNPLPRQKLLRNIFAAKVEVGRPDFCGLGSGSVFILLARVFACLKTILY